MIWIRKNLFRSVSDGIISVIVGGVAVFVAYRLLLFIFVDGRWGIVKANLSLLTHNAWPTDDLWRLASVIMAWVFLAFTVGSISKAKTSDEVSVPFVGRILDLASRLWPVALVVGLLLALTETPGPSMVVLGVVVAAVVGRLCGGLLPGRYKTALTLVAVVIGLVGVWYLQQGLEWDKWGGFFFNAFVAVVSITLCFPLGIGLALGRRSEFPVLRWLSVGFIELFRGVPLITWLLMGRDSLGFFVPQELAPGSMVRGLVVLVLFTAAYVAEIIRGGLQSVPKGQVEAARANGLTPIPITLRIVLPQAIRNVIPALVGQAISLFKDTTLVGVALGFAGLLKVAEAITQQSEFRGQGLIYESLAFVLLIFWAGCFTMSRESQRLEFKLGVGSR